MVQLGAREHAGLISAFSDIAHQMDVLIVDTAAGISDEVIHFLCAAQEIIVVVCNEPTSITDAYALDQGAELAVRHQARTRAGEHGAQPAGRKIGLC